MFCDTILCHVQSLLELVDVLHNITCIIEMYALQSLLAELLPNCDGELKADVTQMAAYYEHRLQLGSKAIFHLEAFVAKFMSIYKRFVEEGLDLMFS